MSGIFNRLKLTVLIVVALTAFTLRGKILQAQGTANMQGRVLDAQGAVIPGADLTLRSQDTGLFRHTISKENGTFLFSGMLPGVYQIEAELPGFKKLQRSNLRLEVGKTLTVSLALEVGEITDEVSVIAEPLLVDTTSKEVGGSLGGQDLTELPTINRNFNAYLALVPGVVVSDPATNFGGDNVSIGGQNASQTSYSLDGSSNNDSQRGGQAGAQARIPIEAIQEFQVLVGQGDAEYGGSGGLLNAVSKQGSNQFHGSAFTLIKDDKLSLNNYFSRELGLEKPNTKEQQFGGTLGGPIVQNKANFFGSLERVILDAPVTTYVPDRPDLNASNVRWAHVWNVFGRFDHQINANNTWGLRWLAEWSPQLLWSNNETLDAVQTEEDLDQTWVASLNSVISPTTLNSLRFGITLEDYLDSSQAFKDNGKNQTTLKPTLNFQSFQTQQHDGANQVSDHTYVVNEAFSWFVPEAAGSHNFKAGGEFDHTTNHGINKGNQNGTFSFSSSNGPFNAADPSTWPDRFSIRVPAPSDFEARMTYWAAYLQDKWKIHDRFTLNLGLRYAVEDVPVDESDNPLFANANDYPKDKNNFAPRVGFSYSASGSGRTVIRGGWGLYNQRTTFADTSNFSTTGTYSKSFTVNFPTSAIDPGPSKGLLPTDPMLVTFPNVNRALVDQMFPVGTMQQNAGTVYLDDPSRRNAYSQQLSFGFQQQVGSSMAVVADYIRNMSRDLLVQKDLNAGLRVNTSRSGRIDRPNPNYKSFVYTRLNLGKTDYDALQLQFERRFSSGYSFRSSYTLAKGTGNIADHRSTSAYQLLDNLNLDLNQGPTPLVRKHNLSLSGTFDVPHTGGLRLSTITKFVSGTPFSLTDSSSDPDQNGVLTDYLPAGTYSGTGPHGITVDYKGGRDGGIGPNQFQMDGRLEYRFRLGESKTLETYADLINLTNYNTFSNPSGDRRTASTFLVLRATRGVGPRSIQFGSRFAF
jgi:Carboxypeptidase regulatory-like domain/TonB-dependent Receptor Plug Domain